MDDFIVCRKCGQEAGNGDQLITGYTCRECGRKYRKAWRAANPEKTKAH